MSSIEKPSLTLSLFHPRYWLTIIGFLFWWLIVQLLPFKVQMYLGKLLGLLVYKYARSRRRIAEKNIALCFPDLSEDEQAKLVKDNIISLGRGVFDTGISWFWPQWRLRRIIDVKGLHNLVDQHAAGNGVLFIGLHFVSMEMASAGINPRIDFGIDGVYRPHDNPVYDLIQRHGRSKHNKKFTALTKRDVRGMVRCLRNGRPLAYLPDQDYGKKHSVFVPFFGIPTATVTAPSQLVKMGRAKALGYVAERKADNSGYVVTVYPVIEGFGETDEVTDARLLNQFVEERVREMPQHYLWVHRRFKSRPDGEPSLY